MKTFQKLTSLFLFVLFSITVYGQQLTEDVVYLKDGSQYRGVIVEQVPNQSLKVQITGGSIIALKMSEVDKITKEAPFMQQPKVQRALPKATPKEKRAKIPFEPRIKGYFFQGQLLMEAVQGGIRIVNGYKFGRFGHVGIGLGIDLLAVTPLNRTTNGLASTDLSGGYLPLYVYYAGDILSKKVTPFYVIEAGYVHPMMRHSRRVILPEGGMEYNETYQIDGGGAMGSIGLGVRFNTSRRINFSLLLNVGVKNVRYSDLYYLYDNVNGTYDTYGTTGLNATLINGGLRFGIGF